MNWCCHGKVVKQLAKSLRSTTEPDAFLVLVVSHRDGGI